MYKVKNIEVDRLFIGMILLILYLWHLSIFKEIRVTKNLVL